MSTIVPFGKYKGRPVDDMLADPNYLRWLEQQDWFRDRYAAIYQIVINQSSEPSETPEHNALQVKFLDPGYCVHLAKQLWPDYEIAVFEHPDPEERQYCPPSIRFEVRGIDVAILLDIWKEGQTKQRRSLLVEIKPVIGDDYPAVLRQMKRYLTGSYGEISVLLVGDYRGVGASREQFVKTFEISGFKVVFANEF